MWNHLQDNGFFSPYPLTFYTLFGLQSTWWLPPSASNGSALQRAGCPCSTCLPRCCEAGAGSSEGMEEGRIGVTSLRSPPLHSAADQSWQGPAQRGPTAVQPPEPARHAGHPCQTALRPGKGCTSLCGAKSRLTLALGTWGHTQQPSLRYFIA